MNFKSLCYDRLKSILGQIAVGETDYQEVASLTEHIGVDYHDRFLVELLQNAEDQTTKAELSEGLAIIVRTDAFVGVLNQGLPFDDAGVRSITSAGISPKKVEESIGNKGVGFKAVFQVSDTPEIFSVATENARLTAVEQTAFRIERNPFDSPSFRNQMKTTVSEMLCEDPNLWTRLESKLGPGKLWPKVLACLKLAAPFKFPKPLDKDIFKARCEALSISNRLLDQMSTLVVLPLLKGEETPKVVERALDELVLADVPGSALLFLRGISRLRIYDHVRKRAWLLSRQQHGESFRLAKGAKIMPLRTTSAQVGMGKISRTHAEWWHIRRRFGHEGDDAESRSKASSIRAAVARLPGKRWQEVQTAYAAVALPRVPSNHSSPKQYPVVGKMCIGLPSRMATGTPAWLDGPFHGNIARTEINLKKNSQPYNRLIFEECVALLWQIVEYVKAVGGIGDRRGILFWFAFKQGALTNYFTEEASLDSAKIILARFNDRFLTARTLILPEKDDSDCFELLFGHVPNLEQFGFHLPDSWLLKEGWDILDSLASQSCRIAPVSMYIDRSKSDKSLIEMASYLQRKAGPEWWEPFLNWLIDRIPIEEVRGQMVLPVTYDVLARPEDRVFFRPHELPVARDANGESEENEESIKELDSTLTTSLRFLDENRVRVRVADRPRDLTDLARKLSPDSAEGIVRRPRRVELINDVLLPALRERTQENPRDRLCIKILSCIGERLSLIGEEDRNRIKLKQLLVPTPNTNASWIWRPAEEVYLGKGWMSDPDQEQLINRAYGHRNGTRLPSWEDFCAWVRDLWPDDESPNLDMWRRHMEAMGVHAQPRLFLVTQPSQFYFKSWSYERLTEIDDAPSCPFQAAASFWDAYLDYLCQRPSRTCSGQEFFARPISWIDGLEDPDTREAVMELVLKSPERYEHYVETRVERENGTDQKIFLSFWMWAIRMQEWKIVPSNDGPRPVDVVWILHGGEQRRRFVEEKLMVWLPPKFNNSNSLKLTAALGVHTPFDAPIERIAKELHQAAEQLPARDQAEERVMKMLIQTLYEWLNERCESHEPGQYPNLECLLTHPVPLLKSERIERVDLEKASCIYLDDDPQRFSHIAGFADSYALPLSAKSGFRAIFDGLRRLLGDKRMRRVSEERIDVGFSESQMMQEGQLLALIEQHVGTNHGDIAQELAALIAFGRREQPMDPGKQTFKEHWSLFQDCRVVFGEFPNDRALEALFDRHAPEGATLYISEEVFGKDKNALVRLSWHVVGSGHRDVFEAFAGFLTTNQRGEFLRQRGIGDAEWDEIGSAIGISLEQSCTRLRVAALALWRREYPQGKVSEFESEWDADSDPVAKVSRFFDIDKSDARRRLNDAQRVMDDEEEAALAEGTDVTIREWQEARELLDLKRVRFSETERNFEKLIRWVAGAITVVASRRYISLDEDSVKSAVDTICSLNCPSALAETRANDQAVLTEALCRAAEVVEKVPQRAMTLLARYLRREADQAPDTVQNLQLRGVPRRELNHIFDHDESERTKQAEEAVQSVLHVAKVLAKQYGEKLDVTMLEDDVHVIRHTTGWWANAFAALRALKRAITRTAPQTGRVLAQKRAFTVPRSWREIWQTFPELGDPEDETPSIPLPTIRILGLEKTSSEIEADLVPGGNGEIERKLRQCVQPDLNLHALANRARASIGIGSAAHRPGGTGGWRTIGQRDDDELVGYLGERYVYEHFLVADFPDFDISCWVSENRGKYEGQTSELIGQGYDFRYRDVTGRLTGRNDAPLCLIEVKTTTGDGQAPFPITANEWRVAQECHDQQDDHIYLIIRVRHVQDAPEIFDVIVDPVQASLDRWLRWRNKDFYLVVGHPTERTGK